MQPRGTQSHSYTTINIQQYNNRDDEKSVEGNWCGEGEIYVV